jgi:hypothetical protein
VAHDMMDIVKTISSIVATCSELTAAVVIVIGTVQAGLYTQEAHRMEKRDSAARGVSRLRRVVGFGIGVSVGG